MRADRTAAQICSSYGVHSTQVSQWKKQLIQAAPQFFARRGTNSDEERQTAALYEEIGRLKVELDWLKKKL